MRTDDVLARIFQTGIIAAQRVRADCLTSGQRPAAEGLAADSWSGAGPLFGKSLIESLEGLLDLVKDMPSAASRAVREILFELLSRAGEMFSSDQPAASALRSGAGLLKHIFLLKAVLTHLAEQMGREGKTAEEIKPFKNFIEQCERFEAICKTYQEQGFFMFPLINPWNERRDIQIACYSEKKSRDQNNLPGFSFVMDVDTDSLGRLTFFAQVRERAVNLRAQADNSRFRDRLLSALDGLENALREKEFVLESSTVGVKGREERPLSGQGVEFIA